ncbi:MAG: hypothetical protein IKI11_07980 [Neisseriaceae bacterium]|nr:hypothetical protein [Neisseriaceae bacterium]
MSIPFSERIARFIIWGVWSVVWICILYVILLIIYGVKFLENLNLGGIALVYMILLIPAALTAEILQKYDTKSMIIINTFLSSIPCLLLFSLVGRGGEAAVVVAAITIFLIPLGVVTLINSYIVRMHYVSCRKEQQNENSNEQMTTEEQPFRQSENSISS